MRFRRRSFEEEESSFSSMADLAFLLLIFLMVTTGFVTDKGLEVYLPASEARSELPPRLVVVSIDSQGRIFLDGKISELGEVKSYVTSRISNAPGEFVIIRCDRDTPYRYVIDVMDELTQAGITRIALPTKPEEKGGG